MGDERFARFAPSTNYWRYFTMSPLGAVGTRLAIADRFLILGTTLGPEKSIHDTSFRGEMRKLRIFSIIHHSL